MIHIQGGKMIGMTGMIELWWLLTAHFICDWGLQNRWMADNKSKYYEILFAHCMIYTGGISIALEYIGEFALWKVLFILIGHFVIDLISSISHKITKDIVAKRMILWSDHLLHLIQLLIIIWR